MPFKLLISLIATVFLTACVIDDKINEKIQNKLDKLDERLATVSLVLDKKLSQNFDQVWIELHSIDAIDNNGEKIQLVSNPTPAAYNLVSESSARELIKTLKLPANEYKTFELKFGSTLRVVDKQGEEKEYTFYQTSDTYTMTVPANVVLKSEKVAAWLLQLDIAKFTFTELNEVIPNIEIIESAAEVIADIDIDVEAVVKRISDSEIIVQLTNSEVEVSISTHTGTLIHDEATNELIASLSLLNENDHITISGRLDINNLELNAHTISISIDTEIVIHNEETAKTNMQVNGVVTEVNLDSNKLLFKIRGSKYLPTKSIIEVIDISNAVFKRGNTEILEPGHKLKIKGLWNGEQLVAQFIELKGAPANYSDQIPNPNYRSGEIKGIVINLDGDLLKIDITDIENLDTPDKLLSINITNAWIVNGDSTCLKSGEKVKLFITELMDSIELTATVIEISGHCNSSDSDHANLMDDPDIDDNELQEESDDANSDDSINKNGHNEDKRRDDGKSSSENKNTGEKKRDEALTEQPDEDTHYEDRKKNKDNDKKHENASNKNNNDDDDDDASEIEDDIEAAKSNDETVYRADKKDNSNKNKHPKQNDEDKTSEDDAHHNASDNKNKRKIIA